MKMIWLLIKRWWYTGIFLLVLIPSVGQASVIQYTKEDDQTIAEVAEIIAKEHNVAVESLWIWDEEFDANHLYVSVPDPVVVEEIQVDATDVELFEVDDERTKLMNQIIVLLKELIRLQNEQKL